MFRHFLGLLFFSQVLCGESLATEGTIQKIGNYVKSLFTSNSDLQNLIQSLQRHVVSIKTRAPVAAYSQEGTNAGSGCIVSSNIIVTNAHVVGKEKIARYEVTLFDGRELEAHLLYVDPWLDIAFLKVSSNDLQPTPLGGSTFNIGQPVYIIGRNENMHFSTQTGTIANPYETISILPGQVFRISLNAQGGASGSPVFNDKGQMVGLVFASNNVTSAFAYPTSYIQDLLKFLNQNQQPHRFGVGCILDYISVDSLVRYYRFPLDRASQYRSTFKDAFNRILFVKHVLKGSPADGLLKPGDVLIKINGKKVGPSLYDFDTAMNNGGQAEFEIIRPGIKDPLTVSIPTYNLFDAQIKRMVGFGGAIFYEADDSIAYRTGVKGHPVFITNVRSGSSFFERLPVIPQKNLTLVSITKMGDFDIKTLDDVIKAIPHLIQQRDFTIEFQNYGLEAGFDHTFFFNQALQIQEITYARQDGLPEVFTWNPRALGYDVKTIDMSVKESIF